MSQSILEMAKDLVIAQVEAGQLSPDGIQEALQKTYTSLMTLKTREDTGAVSPVETPAPIDWRKSITRHTITCLECGATYKQLSARHLGQHDLDARSYRAKYDIPRTQPLAAKLATARRRQVAQEIKPWEKAPRYIQAQKTKAEVARKTGRKRVVRENG